jgi:hypothetical protein
MTDREKIFANTFSSKGLISIKMDSKKINEKKRPTNPDNGQRI